MKRGRSKQRCPGCFLRPLRCLCEEIPKVDSALDFIILRHSREIYKGSNTGRLAAAALPRCRLVDMEEFGQVLDEALIPPNSWLLFPPEVDETGEETGRHRLLAAEDGPPPGPLIVLDGTWGQARRMSHRIALLDALPRLQLDAGEEPTQRLRKSHVPGAMATLETIARAIELFECPEKARPLYELYREFAQRLRRGHL